MRSQSMVCRSNEIKMKKQKEANAFANLTFLYLILS